MGFLGWAPGNTDAYDLEEGEWFPEDYHGITETSENVSEEGILVLAIDYLVTVYLVLYYLIPFSSPKLSCLVCTCQERFIKI